MSHDLAGEYCRLNADWTYRVVVLALPMTFIGLFTAQALADHLRVQRFADKGAL